LALAKISPENEHGALKSRYLHRHRRRRQKETSFAGCKLRLEKVMSLEPSSQWTFFLLEALI
jgi:hypothetical protein